MIDGPERRNKVAAIVLNHKAEQLAAAIGTIPRNQTPQMRADVTLMHFGHVLAALAGETDPERLGIQPLSLLDMQLASITSEAPQEIPDGEH
ncbi:hypothetical protein [Prescottella equi]|uniref:hypothetical protein n=1 Tax=Rhodococcus hoagii TaxID=43767 RepID=UPI000D0E772E|nr:hypothetical protein [Prescottella equi]AVP71263.1 hypothetical protein C7H75_24585 [Prescottella equi]